MISHRRYGLFIGLLVLLTVALLASSCVVVTPAPAQPAAEEPAAEEAEASMEESEEEMAEAGPKYGSTLVAAFQNEWAGLDPHTVSSYSS